MSLLLDTPIAFWLAFKPQELTAGERAAIQADRNALAVSVVSLWELRIKWSRQFTSGARKGPAEPAAMLGVLNLARISLIPLMPNVAVASLDPPLDHSDPFDELLLTQAQQAGYRLLTRDRQLASHPVALVA